MTRKHFEVAAEQVRTIPKEHQYALFVEFCVFFKQFNSNFDQEKFKDKCGIGQ